VSILVEIGDSSDLAEGNMKEVVVRGRKMLLARIGDSYYAADNRCPHMGARISEGKLEGFVVTCPRHGSQFDLRDGHVIKWTNLPALVAAMGKIIRRPRRLTTYAVKLDGDKIMVEI
jgi:3-phenylpropionate/trans-cinnamate dioxygenase ferredoxin subunit